MLVLQLAIGLVTGILIGFAVFSNPFSRAVVAGMIAGTLVHAIMMEGVESYLQWAIYLPSQVAEYAGFWTGLIAGVLGGTGFRRRPLP